MPNLPPPFYQRLYQFRRAELAGLALDQAKIDSELDRVRESLNQAVVVLRGITDATGRLILQQPLREMRAVEVLDFTATASQTQFYLTPTTDPVTDRAEFHIGVGAGLYQSLDATLVSVAAATTVAAGTVSCVLGSNVYTVSGVLPDPLVGAAATINGTPVGTVTARLSATQFQTTVPWPLASIVVPQASWSWSGLSLATIAPPTPLVAGQKVQVWLYSDGAGALTQLGTATTTTGARQVAVFDFGNIIGSGNVEDAFQEIFTLHNALVTALGPINQYVRRDGSLAMTGMLDGGGNKAVGFAPGTVTGDLVTYEQIAGYIAVWNNLQQFYIKRDGTTAMAANFNFGGNRGINLADGTAPSDAVNLSQLSERIHKDGSVAMEGPLDMGGQQIINGSPATADSGFVTLGQLNSTIGAGSTLVGYTVPGVSGFIVPAGVNRVRVRAWGGGAGGNYEGGGGGAYVETSIPVVAGDSLLITVGAGGTPGGNGGSTQLERNGVVQFVAGGAIGAAGGAPFTPIGLPMIGLPGGQGRWGVFYNTGDGWTSGSADGGNAPQGGQGGRGTAGNTNFGDQSTPGVFPGGGGGGTLGLYGPTRPGAGGALYMEF